MSIPAPADAASPDAASVDAAADQMSQLDRGQEEVAAAMRNLNSFLADDLTALENAVYQPEARPRPLGPVALPDPGGS